MAHGEPILERLGQFAAELRWEDVPEPTRELVRHQLGCIVGAYATGFHCGIVRRVAAGLGVELSERAFPLPRSEDPEAMLGVLCAASMAYDYDDYLFMGHTGHSSVATALVLAGQGPSPADPGEELLTRILIGNELGGRIGSSVFFGPHNGQLWSFIHLAAAAAIHARALGLDAEGIAHALAIAFAQPPYPLPAGFMGASTKILTAATPAVQGFRAARLAARGLTGNLGILEDPRGFWQGFSFLPLPGLMDGLGRTWLTDTLTFKRYPGCAYLGPILDGLVMLRKERPFQASEVESVDVAATFLTVEMDEMARPHREARDDLDPVLLNFSVADTVALDILTGGMRCADLEPERLAARRDEIRTLGARIRLHHAWDLSVELWRSINRTIPLGRLLGGFTLGQMRQLRTQARRYHGRTLDVGLGTLRDIVKEISGEEARALARFFGGRALRPGKLPPPFDLGEISLVAFELPVAARVTLKTTSGPPRTVTIRRPEGSPQTALRLTVVEEKLMRDVGGEMGQDQALALWESLRNLPASWNQLREHGAILAEGRYAPSSDSS